MSGAKVWSLVLPGIPLGWVSVSLLCRGLFRARPKKSDGHRYPAHPYRAVDTVSLLILLALSFIPIVFLTAEFSLAKFPRPSANELIASVLFSAGAIVEAANLHNEACHGWRTTFISVAWWLLYSVATLANIVTFISDVVSGESESRAPIFMTGVEWGLALASCITALSLLGTAVCSVDYFHSRGSPYERIDSYGYASRQLREALLNEIATGSTAASSGAGYPNIDEEQPSEPFLPEVETSIWNILTFGWVTRIIKLGKSRPLQLNDLYALHPREKGAVLSERFDECWRCQLEKPASERSLIWCLLHFSLPTTGVAAVFKFIYDTLLFFGPLILNRIVHFLQLGASGDKPSLLIGLGYVGILSVINIIQTICLHQYFHRQFRSGMRIRSSLISAVYSKSLKIPSTASDVTQSKGTGQIVNLMSVDAGRMQDSMFYIHILWSAPYQVCVGMVMLYMQLGVSTFAGVAIMALSIGLTSRLGMKIRDIQKTVMAAKDDRIKITNELLAGIKVVKLYAWERPFTARISDTRSRELALLLKYQLVSLATRIQWVLTPVLVSLGTFLLYTILGNELDAASAFTALSLFNILRFPMAVLPMVINNTSEALVAAGRLQSFLESPEIPSGGTARCIGSVSPSVPAVSLRGCFFAWPNGTEFLRNISLQCFPSQLTCLVGRTGCGKSGLLQALIGDLEATKGDAHVRGSIAYVAQASWIQNASLRDNIVFGQHFNQERYDKVVEACALTQDFKILPDGDRTEIGEKGVNLSGGQKQRIALARAVYYDADVYLLDDVLSAVDSHVAQHISKRVLRQLLKKKCVILVTNKASVMPYAHQIIFLEQQSVLFAGSYEAASILPEFQEFCAEEDSDDRSPADGETRKPKHRKSSIDSQSSTDIKTDTTPLVMIDDSLKKQVATKKVTTLVEDEYVKTGAVGGKIYKEYIKGVGGFCTVGSICTVMFLGSAFQAGANWWLSYWSDHSKASTISAHTISAWLGLNNYMLFCLAQVALMAVSFYLIAFASQRGAKVFHQALLSRIVRAPMSFFEATPLGRILNRFAKDTYVIDESLPNALASYLNNLVSICCTFLVICFVTPWFIAVLVPLVWGYMYIQDYYIPSSRQVQRLDSVSKSPIFSHFSESLDGLATIRAFKVQGRFIDISNERLDANLRAYYTYISSNRWLATRLEFVGTAVVTFTALFAILGTGSIRPGLGGLALSYALNITQTLNWLVRMASDRESNIVSVERILEYSGKLCPQEAPAEISSCRPPSHWPSKGSIEFQNVVMRYRTALPLVLKDVSFTINPGEKVGVVGRTGSGKSSLLLTMLRLVEPCGGRMLVDGVCLNDIGLEDLRSRFSVIPQDPVLFTGTMRSNLDPFETHSDEQVWTALRRAHLATFVERELTNGLDAPIEEGGRNLSMGQRQLVCLARALLRESRIILLDEATSAVDPLTDQLVQDTIKSQFENCTIVAIAHRLNTVMDYDRIFVFEDGELVENDTPKDLLNRPAGIFKQMVAAAMGDGC